MLPIYTIKNVDKVHVCIRVCQSITQILWYWKHIQHICLEKKPPRPHLPTQDVAKDSLDTLAATLKGTDALIIATGFVPGNPFAMNAEAHAVDNLGTKALVDAAKMSGVNKIVPWIDESQRHDGLLKLTTNKHVQYIIYIRSNMYIYKWTLQGLSLKKLGQMGKRSCKAQVLVSSILTNGRGWGQENSPGFQVARLKDIVFSSQELPLQPYMYRAMKYFSLDPTCVRIS